MKVLAIGDTHGNTSAICNVAVPAARKNGCPIIVQVGDFGYWEHTREGEKFLRKVSNHLVRNDIKLYWVCGNHDNHELLWEKYPVGEDGFCEIRPNLHYVPRGTVFNLDGVTCLGLGGAFSIDKEWRLAKEAQYHGLIYHLDEYGAWNADGHFEGTRELWWPTELIAGNEALTAIANARKHAPIQVMFTHDAPEGVDVPGIHAVDKWKFPETWLNRGKVREVFDVARPQLLVHGHYHVRYTGGIHWQTEPGGPLDGCRIEGLANDGGQGFAILLDFDSLFPAD